MTQDEIIEMAREAGAAPDGRLWLMYAEELEAFAKLVAAKAIAELESQEPVGRFAKFTDGVWRPVTDYSAGVPLYTYPPQRTEQEPTTGNLLMDAFLAMEAKKTAAQPQRTWVELTDDEIKEIVGPYGDTPIKGYTRQLFDKIEAKLKEKNT